MKSYSVTASAPGKVILFGEHAVVHGVTAVAASLSDLRINVDMTSESDSSVLKVTFVDIPNETGVATTAVFDKEKITSLMDRITEPCKYIKLDEDVKTRLLGAFPEFVSSVGQGLSVTAYLVATILPELIWSENNPEFKNVGFNISIKSHGLPIGAGLGSSAAFSVALTGACFRMRQYLFPSSVFTIGEANTKQAPNQGELAIINNLSYAAEVLLHGNPSGLDNTTSCHGGFVRYTRKNIPEGEFQNISVEQMPALNILLTNTKVPRSTKILVAGVKTLLEEIPFYVKPTFDLIEQISLRFLAIIEDLKLADAEQQEELIKQIGHSFNFNHNLLNALGVGHPALTKVHELSASKKMACKLTGAGGGGCAITLVPNSVDNSTLDELRNELSDAGFVTFQSKVGGDGLLWHN